MSCIVIHTKQCRTRFILPLLSAISSSFSSNKLTTQNYDNTYSYPLLSAISSSFSSNKLTTQNYDNYNFKARRPLKECVLHLQGDNTISATCIYMVSKTKKSKMSHVHNRLLHSVKKRQFLHYEEDHLQEIEVLIISAENLKNVKHVNKMRPYAVVYIENEVHVAKTHIDKQGGTDPTWNEIVKVKVRKELLEDSSDVRAALNVDIYDHGLVGEKAVGSARVLLCNVLKGGKPDEPVDNPIQCMTVQVWRPSGKPQGLLNLWVPPTGRFLTRRKSSSLRGDNDLVVEVGKDEAVETA